MKKLNFTLLALLLFSILHSQTPSDSIETAKHLKLMDMLAAKINGGGTNQVTSQAPEQDCLGAITVCQTLYVQEYSYEGQGNNPNEVNSANSCLGAGELNGVWYKIVAAGQGLLAFNIIPNDLNDDYDWAVYDLTYHSCASIFNLPQLEVSCNFSGSQGITGPNNGNNLQDEPAIPVVPGHTYYIYISNFSATQSGYTLDFAPSTIPIGSCAFIYGNVYYDYNQNCQRDNNETGLANQIVYATPGPFYALTDSNGFYTLNVPLELNQTLYITSVPINSELVLTCPSPVPYRSLTITNLDSVYVGNDFAYFGNDNGSTPCPVIYVSNMAASMLACCNNNRYVDICNYGSSAYIGGTLTLNYLDNYIQPTTASLPYTFDNNQAVFNLPVIGIGDCYSIIISEQVIDGSSLGQLACVEAVVGPPPPCSVPNQLWDGSNLIVTGECQVTDVAFTITNNGVGNMQQPEAYKVYRESNLVDNGLITLQAGQSQTLSYPATGETYVILVNQSDYNPNVSNPASFISNCGPEMPPSDAFNLHNQADEPSYVDMNCNTIINSYDPNEKTAVPVGWGPQHFVSATDEIEYKIRFQNLGTAAAQKVVIVDTIDSYLDPATIHLGAASHNYTATLTDGGILTFTFENIQLPPASADETASIGAVQFTTKQRWGNPINYTFYNKAYIYFDNNPAIITNTVFHNVKDNTTAVSESITGTMIAELYPNPANNAFTLKLNALQAGETYTLKLFTATGALVGETTKNNQIEKLVDISTLAKGLYFYQVTTTDGNTAAGRFVKE